MQIILEFAPPAGVCLLGLLSLTVLVFSLRQLRSSKDAIHRLLSLARIRWVTGGLLAGPLVAVLVLALLLAFGFPDQRLMRLAHAALVLGLWIVLTLAVFVLLLVTRLGFRPALSTLAAPVLCVPLVAFLTPFDRFGHVFTETGWVLPFAVGLLMVCAGYLLVWQARRELL